MSTDTKFSNFFINAINTIYNICKSKHVSITIGKSTICLRYTVDTINKDAHRRQLKKDHCDTCITIVNDDLTHFKTIFNIDTIIDNEHVLNYNFANTTIEVVEEISVQQLFDFFSSSILNYKLVPRF